jgi:CpeT protein
MAKPLGILLSLLLLACAPRVMEPAREIPSLDHLTSWMVGDFSSAAQSAQDPKNYFDIRLHVRRIWTDRKDGAWLYVEQAAAETPGKPYRQRVYRLARLASDRFQSEIFMIKGDPLRFAGAWKSRDPLSELRREGIEQKQGCEVMLEARSEKGTWTYEGGTSGSGCESLLRGARYATTQVRIDSKELISWDRGYDAQGKQVWGATQGGYHFLRQP